jgi:hypothetical protein
VFILHVFQDGATADAVTLDAAGGTQSGPLDGTTSPNAYDYIGRFSVGATPSAYHYLWMGRIYAADTFHGGNSTSEDLYFRVYTFTNVKTVALGGVSLATVIENASAGGTATATGDSATASDAGVTTLGSDRLALNFVSVNDDNAISAFTGETGGNWVLATAAYADSGGTDGAIALQSATLTTAGTIDGGTGSIVDIDAWGTVGFALIGTTVDVVTYVPRNPAINHQNPALV